MKHTHYSKILWFMVVAAFLMTMVACTSNDLYSDIPTKAENFLSRYFPGQAVSSVTTTTDVISVKLKGSAGIVFDKNCNWESINGYGSTLPQVLLYDQFPPALYAYLQETGNLDSVYSVTRDSRTYTVVLLDYTIVYNIADNSITGKYAPPE